MKALSESSRLNRNLLKIRLGFCGIFDDGDEWQVAVPACCIEAVADDELVGNHKACVIDLEFFFNAWLGFVEESGKSYRVRSA